MNNADSPAMPSKVTLNRKTREFQPWQFDNDSFVESGLTKREHFAGLAMQGMIASPIGKLKNIYSAYDMAEAAVEQADALLKELEK